jgi:hypothetical protein
MMVSTTAKRSLTSGLCLAMAAIACGDDESVVGTTTSGSGGMTSGGNGGQGGDGGSVASAGMGGTASGGAGGGVGGAPATYPDGPYGNDEGQTFPYLEWEGYVKTEPATLATTETWDPDYTSLDVFMSGAPYALVHTSLTG